MLIRFVLCSLLCFSSIASAKRIKIVRKDKIYLITHPLMKKAVGAGRYVKFFWSEPHTDFKYFLEIYREGRNKQISQIEVSGGSKTMIFKKAEKKKLFWRIFAVSKYGNRSSNKKKFLIPLKY